MVTSRQSGEGHGWLKTLEAGIHVHWCPVAYSNRMSFNRRIRAFLKFSWLAAWKAARLPGDVVLATSTPLTIALPAVHAARRKRIPMVFEVRDLWPEVPIAMGALKRRGSIALARALERFAYRNAARIVALSPDMRDGVTATGYPHDRVTVIPNGCDFRLFDVPEESGRAFRDRHPWLADRPLVVYTGALGLINGVDYLARLAAAVARRDPRVCFLVVGDGREKQNVERVARHLGVLDRNFFMRPSVPKAEVPAVLSAADLATSTVVDRKALWANSANKVFDALAARRPVAINHEGWLAEFIRAHQCGLVLDAHDLDRAAEQLVGALRNRPWLAAAGVNARRAGGNHFNRDALARSLESVLVSVAPEPRRMAA
jgi:glycosyltransferase involved in cell wall biosynthesis